MTFDLTPISVKKADGTPTPMIAYNDGTNNAFANAQLDSTGAIINPATSGLQTTANSALATIVTNTTGLATAAAQSTGNTSLAAVATSTANVDTSLGAKADSAASSDTGTFSLIALMKRLLQGVTTLNSRTPALGSALSAASTPVVIASDQAALPLPTGAATSAKQDTGNTSLASIATNTTGVATAANQSTGNTSLATIATNTAGVATAANQSTANTSLATVATNTGNLDTNLGAKADAAASSDTGTFSVIALVKRALQSLTTLTTNTTGLATAANQTTMTAALGNTKPVRFVDSSTTITRPADTNPYVAGDLVAASTTAASVTVSNSVLTFAVSAANDATVSILDLTLNKTGTGTTQAIFRAHLFSVNPFASAPTNGDNGVLALALKAGYLGAIDVTVDTAFGDGASGVGVPTRSNVISAKPVSGGVTVYAVLECRGSYTPGNAEAYSGTLKVVG